MCVCVCVCAWKEGGEEEGVIGVCMCGLTGSEEALEEVVAVSRARVCACELLI